MQLQSDAERLVAEILACYHQLSGLVTLSPSPHVNALFERVVLTHPQIIDVAIPLRSLCSEGEYQLEAYWTKKILKEKTQAEGMKTNTLLLDFTYYENYVDLVRMEMNAIASIEKGLPPRRFAVLGSGPLPMTSICVLQSSGNKKEAIAVHNFDWDPQAISRSSELCCKLGYGPTEIAFHCVDVQSDNFNLQSFEVVYLASLIGVTDEQKHKAISNTVKQMRQGALLVVRSAHSLRGLLYPVVNITADLTSLGLRPLLVVHPYDHIVNSVVICRVDFTVSSTLNGTKQMQTKSE